MVDFYDSIDAAFGAQEEEEQSFLPITPVVDPIDSILDLQEPPPEQRTGEGIGGFFGDVGAGLAGGTVRGAEMVAQSFEWFLPESMDEGAGQAAEFLKGIREENPEWFGESRVSEASRQDSAWNPRGWFYGGMESLAMMGPGLAVGVVNPLAGAAVVGGQFWGSTAQEAYDEALSNERQGIGEKLTENEKLVYANLRGFWEGGIEALQSRIPFAKLSKWVPKGVQGNIIRGAIKQPGNAAVNTIKSLAKTIGIEVVTELGQEYAGQETAFKYGQAGEGASWDSIKAVIGPTIIMSGILGIAGQASESGARKQLHDALTGENVDPVTRTAAVKAMHDRLKDTDSELAQMWMDWAVPLLEENRPIALPLDEEVRTDAQADAAVAKSALEEEIDSKTIEVTEQRAEIEARAAASAERAAEGLAEPQPTAEGVIEPELETAPHTVESLDQAILNMERLVQSRPNSPVIGAVKQNLETAKAQRAKLLTAPAPAPAPVVEAAPVKAAAPMVTGELDEGAHEAATSPLNEKPEPTEAQKKAGNYEKGHVGPYPGLSVSIENPAGSVREGTNEQGEQWSTELKDHYGYIKRTDGADGEQIDVFVPEGFTPNEETDKVFVVDQQTQAGAFDEHKIIFGAATEAEARQMYLRNYDKTGQGLIQGVSEMSVADFKTWVKQGDTTAPVTKQQAPPVAKKERKAKPAPPAKQEAPKVAPVAAEEAPAAPEVSEEIKILRSTLGEEQIEEIESKAPQSKTVMKVAEKFGKKVVFFEGSEKAHGVYHPSMPDTIFINLDADANPIMVTFGHELLHALKQDKLELYVKLARQLTGKTRNFRRWTETQNSKRVKQGLKEVTDAELLEELLADFTGEQFFNPEFWRDLLKKDKVLFSKLMELFQQIYEQVSRYAPATNKYFKEIKEARAALNEVFEAYAAAQVAEQEAVVIEEAAPKLSMKESEGIAGYLARKGVGMLTSSEIIEASWQSPSKEFEIEGELKTAAEIQSEYASQIKFSVKTPEEVAKEVFKTDDEAAETFTDRISNALDVALDRDKRVEFADKLDAARTFLVDRYGPINKHLGDLVYKLHRMLNNSAATVGTFLQHGKLSWQDNALTVKTQDEGFVPWFQSLGKEGHKFLYWVAAKRAEKLDAQDRENWFSAEQRQVFLDDAEKRGMTEQYEEWNKKLQEFNRNVVDIGIQVGLISPEARGRWMSHYYLPFFRVLEDESTAEEFIKGPTNSKKYITSGIKTLAGGEAMIGDPLQNLMQNWTHIISESQRQVARQAASELMINAGMAKEMTRGQLIKVLGVNSVYGVRGLNEDGTITWSQFEEMNRAQVLDYIDKENRKRKKGDQLQLIERQTLRTANKEENKVMSFMRNGKPVYVKVDDSDLFQALTQIDSRNLDFGPIKVASWFKRLLTFGATFGVGFRIANLLRDTLHSAVVSKSFFPFIDSARGAIQVMRKSQDYVELMASGGGFAQGYLNSADPEHLSRTIRDIEEKEGLGARKRILDGPRKLLDFWQWVGHASEMAARVQLYTNLKEAGKGHMEAAFEARDLLDFALTGKAESVRVLTATIPFLNARMQGLDRLARGARDNPAAFALKGSMVAMASLALWAAFRNDDRYKELEDWDKWQYHHFWIGEDHYRIPKAFEVGAIFGTMFEAAAEVLSGEEEFGYFLDMVAHTGRSTFAIGMPQMVSPLVEMWSNKGTFTGRQIEPEWMRKLSPGARANPWTSQSLKEVGKLTGVSPVKLETAIRGYTATIGTMVLTVSDAILETRDDVVTPKKMAHEYVGLDRFISSRVKNTKYATRYHEFAEEATQLASTISHYQTMQNYKMAQKLTQVTPDYKARRKLVNKVNKKLAGIRKREKMVWSNLSMDRATKREQLDKLREQKNDVYKAAYRQIKRAGF